MRRTHVMRVRYNATLTKQSFADSGVTKLELSNEEAARVMHGEYDATMPKRSFADRGVTKLELGNEGQEAMVRRQAKYRGGHSHPRGRPQPLALSPRRAHPSVSRQFPLGHADAGREPSVEFRHPGTFCCLRRMSIHPATNLRPLLWRQMADGSFYFSDSTHARKMHTPANVVNAGLSFCNVP